MIIENKKELAINDLRKKALDIVEAGIEKVLPSNLMNAAIGYDLKQKVLNIGGRKYDFAKGRLFVIGGGKAAGLMAQTFEEIVGPGNIQDGIVISKKSSYRTEKIKVIATSHPVPDKKGIEGVKELLALKEKHSLSEKDLVVCLISGGGSAMMPSPVEGVILEDKQKITKLLLASGATIHEINSVRKHLSKVKGGRLGAFLAPTKVVSLILSDVVGNDLDVIASGPTYPDSSTFSDALLVLEKYGLVDKAPKNIVDLFKKGGKETPKSLTNCDNYIIGDNEMALEAMAQKAKILGFKPHIITWQQAGDPVLVAQERNREILEGKYKDYDVVIFGGETTPKLPQKPGLGGRNQHYGAVSLLLMGKYPLSWVMANAATDGADFLPGVAGVIIDKNSLTWAKEKKLDIEKYLKNYDSNTLFEKIGCSLLKTGHTDTNVGDITLYILPT